MVIISSLNATSVTISWTQPDSSPPVIEYIVSPARVVQGNGTLICPMARDLRQETTTNTSASFNDLQESSIYTTSVVVFYQLSMTARAEVEFNTTSAGRVCMYPHHFVFVLAIS
jgi:hypothetical protein